MSVSGKRKLRADGSVSHCSVSSFPAAGKDEPERWLRAPVPGPSEVPQKHHGDASAALARLHRASPCSSSLTPQFELRHYFSPQLSHSICTGSSRVWVSVLKTPVPPSMTFCALHLLSYTAPSHWPSGPGPAAPFSIAHATGIAAPGRSHSPPFPHVLLAGSPVLISSCSAVQSFCVPSLLENAAAAVLSSDVATGHCV